MRHGGRIPNLKSSGFGQQTHRVRVTLTVQRRFDFKPKACKECGEEVRSVETEKTRATIRAASDIGESGQVTTANWRRSQVEQPNVPNEVSIDAETLRVFVAAKNSGFTLVSEQKLSM